MKFFSILLSLFLFTTVLSNSATINIPADQPTIQAGIDAALDGDTISLSAGTYTGPGNRDILVHNKTTYIVGTAGKDSTIIDCAEPLGTKHRGFVIDSCQGDGVTIVGITIMNGQAEPIDINDYGIQEAGGALVSRSSTVSIINCDLINNNAAYGADCYFDGASTANISNCSIGIEVRSQLSNITINFSQIGAITFEAGTLSCTHMVIDSIKFLPYPGYETISFTACQIANDFILIDPPFKWDLILDSMEVPDLVSSYGDITITSCQIPNINKSHGSLSITNSNIDSVLLGYVSGYEVAVTFDGVDLDYFQCYGADGQIINSEIDHFYARKSYLTINQCDFPSGLSFGRESIIGMTSCDIYGSTGNGLTFDMDSEFGGRLNLSNCHVYDNAGNGIVIVDKVAFSAGGCLIENNGHGVVISIHESGSASINSIIRNNSNSGIISDGWGYDLNISGSIFGNGAHGLELGKLNLTSPSHSNRTIIDHATIANNSLDGILASEGDSILIQSSVISFNGGTGVFDDTLKSNYIDISCSDIFGNHNGNLSQSIDSFTLINGNLNINPHFCSYPSGDYSLQSSSPCLPSGNSCGVLMGAEDQGCPTITDVYIDDDWSGPFVGTELEPFTTLLDGLNTLSSGGTMHVAQGSYNESLIPDFPLSIIGADGSEVTTITAMPNQRVLTLVDIPDTFFVSGVTLTGGNPQDDTINGNYGGGVLVKNASVVIDSSSIILNQVPLGFNGGGIAVRDGGYLDLQHSIVANNYSANVGGGLQTVDATGAIIKHTLFYSNNSENNGGGIFLFANGTDSGNHVEFMNNTVAHNNSGFQGAGLEVNRIDLEMRNNIFFENCKVSPASPSDSISSVFIINSTISNDYNNILQSCLISKDNGFGFGPNTIFVDPMFVDPLSADYTLQVASPCINAGDPNPFYNDPDSSRNDIGAYFFKLPAVCLPQDTVSFIGFRGFEVVPDFTPIFINNCGMDTLFLNYEMTGDSQYFPLPFFSLPSVVVPGGTRSFALFPTYTDNDVCRQGLVTSELIVCDSAGLGICDTIFLSMNINPAPLCMVDIGPFTYAISADFNDTVPSPFGITGCATGQETNCTDTPIFNIDTVGFPDWLAWNGPAVDTAACITGQLSILTTSLEPYSTYVHEFHSWCSNCGGGQSGCIGSPTVQRIEYTVLGCCITPGDFNHEGTFNIADVSAGIARIFSGGPPPLCQDEADANGDNQFNIADVTFGINRIFGGGPAPVCGTTGT